MTALTMATIFSVLVFFAKYIKFLLKTEKEFEFRVYLTTQSQVVAHVNLINQLPW